MTSQFLQNISPGAKQALDGITAKFQLPDDRLVQITQRLTEAFSLGLREPSQPVAMIPTYVTRFPDGTEKGTYLVLDLSGPMIGISKITLGGDRKFTREVKTEEVPAEIKLADATEFFEYVANFVNSFLEEKGLQNESLELGLDLAFPVEKTALNAGKLLAWTKGYDVKNAVGKDVLQLLQDAFNRKHLNVKCIVQLNDTVATLLSKYYTTGPCILGVMFGVGTNCVYTEDVAKITKLARTQSAASGGKMVINTEWGAFGDKILPTTSYDTEVDQDSNDPGVHVFEKMVAELYLGEIVRNIIAPLIVQSPALLFNGVASSPFHGHFGFITQHMAMIEGASSLEDIKRVLVDSLSFKPTDVSDQDAAFVRLVCEQVAIRSAKLYACAIAAVLIHSGHAKLRGGSSGGGPKLVIAAEGNMIRSYPGFQTHLRQALGAIVGKEVEEKVEFDIVIGEGSLGVAVCTANFN